MMVNTNKGQIMLVTKKRSYQQLTVVYNNELLQSVDNFTYLGVNFSKSNSFTKGLKERSQQIYQSQSVLDLHYIHRHQPPTLSNYLTLYLTQNYYMAAKHGELETIKP